MREGVAANIRLKPGNSKTVCDWIRDAHNAGARCWGCAANLELFDMREGDHPRMPRANGGRSVLQKVMV